MAHISRGERRPQSDPSPAVLSLRDRIDSHSIGYHQDFKHRSEPLPPLPSYTAATSRCRGLQRTTVPPSVTPGSESLPAYDCSLNFNGFLDLKCELSGPFENSSDDSWRPVYAVLTGTLLSLYHVKPRLVFKNGPPKQGRLLKSYTLQHAEVGVAVDWQGSELIPKSSWTRMLPKTAQRKLWESDPLKFEPIREFVLRLRVETEQLLLSSSTHEGMLDWVEHIAAGLDLAPPLEDRSMPKFRSLPRRTRRQRQIEEAARLGPSSQDGSDARRVEIDRRLVAQQEQLFRQLYPHLATDAPAERNERQNEERQEGEEDPDAADLDPADAREEGAEVSPTEIDRTITRDSNVDLPVSRPTTASVTRDLHTPSLRSLASRKGTYNPKTAPIRPAPTPDQLIRLRRRCAPILLAKSPRASPIIYDNGKRVQIDMKRLQMSPFVLQPPRYSSPTLAVEDAAPRSKAFDITAREWKTIQHVTTPPKTTELSVPRPGLDRGLSGATFASASSAWTSSNETDVDESAGPEEQNIQSLPRAYDSLEELGRVQSAATDKSSSSAADLKGKGRAIFTIRKIKVQQFHEHDEVAIYAPLLV
jgi:hypothetical protein